MAEEKKAKKSSDDIYSANHLAYWYGNNDGINHFTADVLVGKAKSRLMAQIEQLEKEEKVAKAAVQAEIEANEGLLAANVLSAIINPETNDQLLRELTSVEQDSSIAANFKKSAEDLSNRILKCTGSAFDSKTVEQALANIRTAGNDFEKLCKDLEDFLKEGVEEAVVNELTSEKTQGAIRSALITYAKEGQSAKLSEAMTELEAIFEAAGGNEVNMKENPLGIMIAGTMKSVRSLGDVCVRILDQIKVGDITKLGSNLGRAISTAFVLLSAIELKDSRKQLKVSGDSYGPYQYTPLHGDKREYACITGSAGTVVNGILTQFAEKTYQSLNTVYHNWIEDSLIAQVGSANATIGQALRDALGDLVEDTSKKRGTYELAFCDVQNNMDDKLIKDYMDMTEYNFNTTSSKADRTICKEYGISIKGGSRLWDKSRSNPGGYITVHNNASLETLLIREAGLSGSDLRDFARVAVGRGSETAGTSGLTEVNTKYPVDTQQLNARWETWKDVVQIRAMVSAVAGLDQSKTEGAQTAKKAFAMIYRGKVYSVANLLNAYAKSIDSTSGTSTKSQLITLNRTNSSIKEGLNRETYVAKSVWEGHGSNSAASVSRSNKAMVGVTEVLRKTRIRISLSSLLFGSE